MDTHNEKIIEKQGELSWKDKKDHPGVKTCRQCSTSFHVTEEDLVFYEKVSPVFNRKKYLIPSPTLCSECSIQNKFTWRNDKNFYRFKTDKKDLISMYKPDTTWNIIDSADWWDQKYTPAESIYDINKGFFEQFWTIVKNTAHPHIITMDSENSEYTNFNGFCKDSYLCAAGNYSENISYCYNAEKTKNSLDCLFVFQSENCYELIHSSKCYRVFFSLHCEGCSDWAYLEDCNWCSNCYMCVGLKNKKYHILNKEYSKEEYFTKIEEIEKDKQAFIEKFESLRLTVPKRANYNFNSEKSSWEYIIDSQNCQDCYIMSESCVDCKNVLNWFPHLSDSHRCCFSGENAQLFYETMWSGAGWYKNAFGLLILNNPENNYYCDYCISSKNCFWCSGLHNAEYCILNKQYTKEQYENLVPKIIAKMIEDGEWWEFFPSSLSPFGYNETVATEYFPLTKKQAVEKGFNWSDYTAPLPKVEKIIPANKLPQAIEDVPDDILAWAIECEVSKKPFRIIPSELAFYRKHNISIPKRHPDQRHLDRMRLRNPRKLSQTSCDGCKIEIQTTYDPERKERVYCTDCYNKHIY